MSEWLAGPKRARFFASREAGGVGALRKRPAGTYRAVKPIAINVSSMLPMAVIVRGRIAAAVKTSEWKNEN
jgi:hypothetical protein